MYRCEIMLSYIRVSACSDNSACETAVSAETPGKPGGHMYYTANVLAV